MRNRKEIEDGLIDVIEKSTTLEGITNQILNIQLEVLLDMRDLLADLRYAYGTAGFKD